MAKILVYKITKYTFLLFSILSFFLSILICKTDISSQMQSFVSKSFCNILGDDIQISSSEHHFIPFNNIIFTDFIIKSKIKDDTSSAAGFSFKSETLHISNSFLSVLSSLIFSANKIRINFHDGRIYYNNEAFSSGYEGDKSSLGYSINSKVNNDIEKKVFNILNNLSRLNVALMLDNFKVIYDSKHDELEMDNFSFFVSVRKNYNIDKLNVNFPYIRYESANNINFTLNNIRNFDNKNFKIDEVRLRLPNLSIDEKDYIVGWNSSDGFSLDIPILGLNFLDFSISAKKNNIGFNLVRDKLSIFLHCSEFAYNVSKKLSLGFSSFSALYSYKKKNQNGKIELNSDFDVLYGNRVLLSAPFSLETEKFDSARLLSSSFVSPYFDNNFILASSLDDEKLTINIESDSNHEKVFNMNFGIKNKTIEGSMKFLTKDFKMSNLVSRAIKSDGYVLLKYSMDLQGHKGSIDIEGTDNIFGQNIHIDENIIFDREIISFSGSGLKIGKMNLVPHKYFVRGQENKKISFDLFKEEKEFVNMDVNLVSEILELNLDSIDKKFLFNAKLNPFVQNKQIDVKASISDITYNFVCYVFPEGFNIRSDGFSLDVDFYEKFTSQIQLNNFVVPVKLSSDISKKCYVNMNLYVAVDKRTKSISFPDSNISILADDFAFSTGIEYVGRQFRLKNFFCRKGQESYNATGWLEADYFSKEFYKTLQCHFYINDATGNKNTSVDFVKQPGQDETNISIDTNFSSLLEFLSIGQTHIKLNATTDWKRILFLEAFVSFFSKTSGKTEEISAMYDGNYLNFESDRISYKKIVAEDILFNADFSKASLNADMKLTYFHERLDKIAEIKFAPHISMTFEDTNNLKDLVSRFGHKEKKIELKIDDIILEHDKFDSLNLKCSVKDNEIIFEDGFLIGKVSDKFKNFDFKILQPFPIVGDFNGRLSEDNAIIRMNFEHLPADLSKYFVYRPIFKITQGDFSGYVLLTGKMSNLEIYCNLFANEFKVWNFWTENEFININNVNVVGYNHDIKLLRTTATSVNKKTGRISLIETEGGVTFERSNFSYWYINAFVPEGQYIEANIPIPAVNYNINVDDACGDFYMYGVGMDSVEISGDFYCKNAILSSPIQAPNFVFSSSDGESVAVPKADVNINLKTGKNIRLVYPDTKNPIINAFVKENQKFAVKYNDSEGGSFTLDGRVEIENGNAYYLNRKFDIEKGEFFWRKKNITSSDSPIINLRASYRDYDKDNNGINLYINFNNASIDNINPTFSSSSLMSESEIMMRLGKAVVQTDTSSSNLQYLTSLSVTMFDLLTSFNNNVKIPNIISFIDDIGMDLDLDVFSLQTNFFANFISDVTPSLLNQGIKVGGSAFSRYFDGTILSVAKKIRPKIMLSFSSEFVNVSNTYNFYRRGISLGGDLMCMFAFNLQWDSPFLNFEIFSKPNDLSIAGMLSGYGFSISRTIVL